MKKIKLIFVEEFKSKTKEDRKINFVSIYNKINQSEKIEQNSKKI